MRIDWKRSGKIILPLAAAVVLLISSLTGTHSKIQAAPPGNVDPMVALGQHKLTGDEFAVILRKTGQKMNIPSTAEVRLSTGQFYKLTTDQFTETEIIEGSDTQDMYVPQNSSVEIHTYDELDNRTGKIDEGVKRKLAKSDVVSVIIQMNVPYAKFYEAGDSGTRRQDKKNQFAEAKGKINASMSGKGKVKQNLEIINGISADVDAETLAKLSANPTVKKIELDRKVRVFLDTSVDEINARSVWQLYDVNNNILTGVGKRIAVIDTGVDYTHPDLGGCFGASCKVIGGYDCINNDTDPMDDHGHGTHVAATAAGKGTAANGQQLWGVAPDAKILAYKVLNSSGSGSTSQVLCGMNRAVDPNGDGNSSDHADVATMSLGGSGDPDDSMSLAADNGAAAGVVFTIAAGNSGPTTSTIMSPGTSRTAITVAAACKTSQLGQSFGNFDCYKPIASFSSRGPLIWNGIDIQKPDIAAPGAKICAAEWDSAWSTSRCFDTSHVSISGTSMATPHVAGAAALIRQAYPNFPPAQVKQQLKNTAKNLGLSYNDQGAGEIDLKAAIPFTTKINAAPASWNVTSDPTQKNNSFSQSFSATPINTDINSLTISSNVNIPGVTVSFNKSVLQVANKTTDSFVATITIDNDMARSGTYYDSIIFSENNTIKGIIPILLILKPTLTVSAVGVIDYGLDDPTVSVWTSATKTFTVTNLRTDISQNLTISSSAYPAGIAFQSPTALAVPSGKSVTFDTNFMVTNANVANGIYNGSFSISNPAGSVIINTTFKKYYQLIINDSNANELSMFSDLVVHNRKDKTLWRNFTTVPLTIYLTNPGLYDVIITFDPISTNTGIIFYTLFKEGVSISTGTTTLNVSRSEAKHKVDIIPTDENGAVVSPLTAKEYRYTYLPVPNLWPTHYSCCSSSKAVSTEYISDVSSNYKKDVAYPWPSSEKGNKIHYFYSGFTGLTGDLIFKNSPGDFKVMNLPFSVDQQTGTVNISLTTKINNTSLTTWHSTGESLPFHGTLFSLLPSDTLYWLYTYGTVYYDGIDGSPSFNLKNPHQRSFENLQFNPAPSIVNELPFVENDSIYFGLGPSYWSAKFINSPTNIRLSIYYDNKDSLYPNYPNAAFLRQDYSMKSYPATPINIYQNNNLIASSTLSPFAIFLVAASWPHNISSINLPSTGKYEARVDFPYKNKGLDMLGKVRASFDTSLADPNPPAFKRLYYYSNNARSEVYDSSKPNRVEFELDPIGGTMGTVTVNYTASGGTMTPAAMTVTNGVYSANIPSVSGLTKMTIQITGADSSGNSLSYTFELPVSTAPPVPSGTIALTPTPAGKPGDANGDMKVDEADYTIWLAHFGQSVSGVANGDFNADNKVDGVDFSIWTAHYGT